MELRFDSELQGDILVATASGTVSFDSVLRLFKEVCNIAAENQVSKILVNSLGVDGELAPFERYRLGTDIAEYLIQRQINVKVALVGAPPAVNGFGARIARNRGVAASVFSNREDALNWIGDLTTADDIASAAP